MRKAVVWNHREPQSGLKRISACDTFSMLTSGTTANLKADWKTGLSQFGELFS